MKKRLTRLTVLLLGASMLSACSFDTTVKKAASESDSANASNSASVSSVSASEASSAVSSQEASTSNAADNASTEISSSEQVDTASEGSSSVLNDPTGDGQVVIVFLGDSQFANGREEGTSVSDYVHNATGYTVYNLGCGGTTASTKTGEQYQYSDASFYNVSEFLNGRGDSSIFDYYGVADIANSIDPAKVDYYVVEYGVNDFLSNRPQADSTDIKNVSCYVNAMHVALFQLTQASPKARIVCCSPIYCQFWGKDGAFLGDGNMYHNSYATYEEYAGNCIQTAENEGCIIFDAYHGRFMDLDTYTAKDYLADDGIHLTQRGRKVFAAVVTHLINRQLGLDDTYLDNPYKIADY